MKKSSIHLCICLVLGLLVAVATLLLEYCGMVPNWRTGAKASLVLSTGLMALFLVGTACAGCCCMRKLSCAMCRYGTALACLLPASILLSLAVLTLADATVNLALFMTTLLLSTWSFVSALTLSAAALNTMAKLGCPRCKPLCQQRCEDDDFES